MATFSMTLNNYIYKSFRLKFVYAMLFTYMQFNVFSIFSGKLYVMTFFCPENRSFTEIHKVSNHITIDNHITFRNVTAV